MILSLLALSLPGSLSGAAPSLLHIPLYIHGCKKKYFLKLPAPRELKKMTYKKIGSAEKLKTNLAESFKKWIPRPARPKNIYKNILPPGMRIHGPGRAKPGRARASTRLQNLCFPILLFGIPLSRQRHRGMLVTSMVFT